MACSPISFKNRVVVTKLPVFEPNEYFWSNHQKEGEEKWQTYARVIRDIMSEHGDIPKSDKQIEDKFEYKAKLYPKQKHKSAD